MKKTGHAAIIGEPTNPDVTEDATTTGTLVASGTISISDPDPGQGQSSFRTAVQSAAGNLGILTIAKDGSYTYSVLNSATQYLSATDTKTDTFTVTSLDGTTKQVSFAIHGAQDAPHLVLGATIATGASDANIALSVGANLVDTSSTLTVEIDGVPDFYSLSHGTALDDGRWLVSAADLPTLALVPGSGAVSGNFNLHVTAISDDGVHQAVSLAQDIAVTISPSANEHGGRIVDGYIAGATVFADANNNGVLDLGEVHTTTNADGSFTLIGGSGPLISMGGTDVSTGLPFDGVLRAPAGSTVITPLTTLISALLPNNPTQLQIDTASDQVAGALGLNLAIDLQTFDPVPGAVTGNAAALAVLSAAIQVQSTVVQLSAAVGGADPLAATSAAVFTAIANAITTAPATFDLTTSSTLTSIATASGVSATEVAAVANIVSSANTVIDTSTTATTLAQAAEVAQGVTTTALAGSTDPNTLVTTYSTTAIQTLANNATVGDVNGAQLGTLGNDVLLGDAGNNSIDGLDGSDQISGGAGNDFLYGGDGKDRLTGGAGNDLIDGGSNYDRAVYTDATGAISVNLLLGTVTGAGIGTDTMVAIEGVTGSDYNDTFDATGFTGVTGIPGGVVGNNDFEGGKGDDHIIGFRNLSGQALSRVSYFGASGSVTVDIQAGTADGTLSGDVAAIGHDTFSNVNGIYGSAYDDILLGSDNAYGSYEAYEGRRGNDFIDGRGGYDIVVYSNDPATAAGITVHLADGTVTGDATAGTVGTDTLRAVEAVRGTNFDDLFDATGFGLAGAANIGSFGTFNDFQGAGGNDRVIGNGNTRVNYTNAGGAMLVDLQITTGTATTVGGTATGFGEGTDTLTGVNAAQGSSFGDTLLGSDFNNVLTGLSGDDSINGRGGFDTASYNSLTTATGGVDVHLAAGTATGLSDGSIGHDTLRSIEGIQGTVFVDHFDATGYGAGGALNIGNNGTFNQFEGLGGDDVITGNGNTRIGYFNATAGVTVVFTGSGTGTADGNSTVGHDTFTNVNSVSGSGFGDTIGGDGNSNTMTGGGGNDAIDGGGGADLALFTGVGSAYTISPNTPAVGQTTVTDSVVGRDGMDTLTNIEIVQFSDSQVLLASGSAAIPVDVSDGRLFFGGTANSLTTLSSSTSSDFLKIGFSLSGHLIDLGAGADDTVSLGPNGSYTLKLANVEHVVGSGGNDIVTLSNTANGLTVDLGAGTNTLNLAAGINSIAATPGSSLFINGTASQDSLTFSNTANGQFVDLGAGGNDTLVLTSTSLNFITVANIENVVGSAGVDDIVIANTAGPTTVTGGLGVDHITASAGQDNFRFTSVADSTSGAADNITNFNAGGDTFTFSGMTIAGSNIQYVDIGSFAANGQASAHLQNVSPGNDLLQIDINGDGVMNANDIEVHLTSLAGTLSNSNFVLI